MASKRALTLPGKVFEGFGDLAQEHLDAGTDLDLCEALSRAQVKPRGRGFSVLIPMEPEQVGRLADWVSESDPKLLRDYKQAMKEQVAQVEIGTYEH